MGIVRTTTTRVLAPFEAAHQAVAAGMAAAALTVGIASNPLVAESKFSLRKNRHKATVTAGVRPESDTTSLVDWSVDMLGDKHHEVVEEIIAAMPVEVDDLGVADALERLGKMGRFFGFREAAALSQFLHIDERVVELAQGVYDGNQGMLVLTTRRLFFFEKKKLSAKVEEFELSAIGSMGFGKKLGGEMIEIAISGRSAQIKQVSHGRAETLVQAFRRVKAEAAAPAEAAAVVAAVPDAVDQLRKLAELRDASVLTEDEFAAKKAELLARM